MLTATGMLAMWHGKGLDVHGQRGRQAAKALRADADAVDPLQQLLLQLGQLRVGVGAAHLAQQRVLGQPDRLLGRAADAHADDDRRAGVAPASRTASTTKWMTPSRPSAGLSMPNWLMFSLPPPLGATMMLQPVAGHDRRVDDRRGVVLGVDAGREGLLHHRLAQVAVVVAPAHALGDRLVQVAAGDVHVLAQAPGRPRSGRCPGRGASAGRGPSRRSPGSDPAPPGPPARARLAIVPQGGEHVLTQVVVALDAQPRHGLA